MTVVLFSPLFFFFFSPSLWFPPLFFLFVFFGFPLSSRVIFLQALLVLTFRTIWQVYFSSPRPIRSVSRDNFGSAGDS